MKFYDQQILAKLKEIPTPNYPGSIVVTGISQSVFTGPNPGETFLAACEHGKGKIFVAAHDSYLKWLDEKDTELKKQFMKSLKIWLTGEDVHESKTIDFGHLERKKESFDNYKLIKWHQDYDPSEEIQSKLLKYIQKGGALFCGSTPWGYLQIYPNKRLHNMTMYNFLKKHTGIILTSNTLFLPNQLSVSENKAKLSHFDYAIEKVTINPNKIEKYLSTIYNGLDILNNEGLLENEKIISLKNLLCENCESSGWNTRPNETCPIIDSNEKNAIKLIGKCLNFTEGEKAQGIEEFPGDFEELPELLENIDLDIEAKFEERISTGYYLPAGVKLNLNVTSGETNGWTVRIGAHTDDLSGCESFKRWPCITILKNFTEEFSICSPYGGLIYFESSGPGSFKVSLSNVIKAPYYDLTKPDTILNWDNDRHALGLWAELAGENIIFTTPSSCIRHIENPEDVLKFWDSVVETHHQCRGTNVKDYKRERIVNDMQPSCGYMHSGYPIVTHLDCCQSEHGECIFDLEKLKENGNWGLFHELGHNMQRDEWTFDGCGEVTVNIFSMHGFQFVVGQDIIDQKWPRDRIDEFGKYFSKKPTYEDWKNDCGMALMTFAQLIKHFGWDSMHTFMKEYETDMKSNSDQLPKSNQEKIDQWVLRYSKIVSKNIKPQFEMFGLPVSSSVNKELSELERWCPVQEKDSAIFFSKLE